MRIVKPLSFGVALALTGCATVHPSVVDSPLARPGSATLVLQPKLQASRYVQTVFTPYTAGDIATLSVVPYLFADGSYQPLSSVTGQPTTLTDPNLLQVSQASPSIDLSKTIVLSNLLPKSQYRVFAQAYDSSNTLISNPSSSSVDLTVSDDDRPSMGTLPLQLADRLFSGHTSVRFQKSLLGGSNFATIDATLVSVVNGTEVPIADFPSAIGTGFHPSSLALTNLQPNTTYRVKATVKDANGSVLATPSVDIPVSNDDAPSASSISLAGIPYNLNSLGIGFLNPNMVAVDGNGSLYVADTYHHRIVRMDASGKNLTVLGSGFSYPSAVAVDKTGNIYVADTAHGAIKRMDASGSNITTLGSGFSSPTGVAVDAFGSIYVADSGHNAIKRMDASGNNITPLGSGFSNPSAVALDATGSIYVADTNHNAIVRMDASGNNSTTLGSGFYFPAGVAVDAAGNIYVADTNNNRIKRMDASGNNLATLGSGFTFPTGVAVDAAGNIYVADNINNAIKKLW